MATNFQLNQMVRLKGLNNAAYNDKLGRVVLFPNSMEECCNGRYRVILIGEVAPPLLRELSVKPENMEHACKLCHKGGENLMFCGKCRNARYCDRECQRIDWERHKLECESCDAARISSKYPLLIASGMGDLVRIRKLVEEGIDVNASNSANLTALQVAAADGHFDIVQYLLQQGADRVKADNDGFSPLIWAARNGHLMVVQLLEQGMDKDKADNNGCSPLFAAAQFGHLDVG